MQPPLSHEELVKSFETEMEYLKRDREYTLSIYQKIETLMENCLKSGEYSRLFELLPYFEEPDTYPRFHLNADSHRVHVTLNVLKLELAYHSSCFLSTVKSYSDFLKQYIQTVFYLRRLELSFSSEAMVEAAHYIQALPLSIYAAKIISENERFENYERLYLNLHYAMQAVWKKEEKQLWLRFLAEKASHAPVLLETASLCMDMEDYHTAVACLSAIPAPEPETKQLLTTLKELLAHESK